MLQDNSNSSNLPGSAQSEVARTDNETFISPYSKHLKHQPWIENKTAATTVIAPVAQPEPICLSRAESASALARLVIAALPILAFAAGLRFWDLSEQSPFMDETIYIITGRLLNEQGQIYSNAMQWTFGSFLYPMLVGALDQQGGLWLARSLSLVFGLVTILSTILLTLGLFKAMPSSASQARADFALSSKPVVASLIAGMVVAILPTALALSQYATYDSMAMGLFAAGTASFAWGLREAKLARLSQVNRPYGTLLLFALAATLLFAAFLTKYIVALYFPLLCLLVMISGSTRLKGLLAFVMPLSLACGVYYFLFRSNLNSLLQFSAQFKDLKSDDWFRLYIINRFDLLIVVLVAYWGFRQARRNRRTEAALLLAGGALAMLLFQISSRADYDYWKHSIYLVFMLAPLVGWLWADWTWWDDQSQPYAPRVRAWWQHFRQNQAKVGRPDAGATLERAVGGNALTERPGSYSLVAIIFVVLGLIGIFWSVGSAKTLLNRWPSYTSALTEITRYSQEAAPGTILTDDNALLYYLYDLVPLDKVTDPFYLNYKGVSSLEAYRQAVRDQQYSLIILNGGATARGQQVYDAVQPLAKNGGAYKLVYQEKLTSPYLEGPHTIEIYRLKKPAEQVLEAKQPPTPPR